MLYAVKEFAKATENHYKELGCEDLLDAPDVSDAVLAKESIEGLNGILFRLERAMESEHQGRTYQVRTLKIDG